jgi:hypothetical protein
MAFLCKALADFFRRIEGELEGPLSSFSADHHVLVRAA